MGQYQDNETHHVLNCSLYSFITLSEEPFLRLIYSHILKIYFQYLAKWTQQIDIVISGNNR